MGDSASGRPHTAPEQVAGDDGTAWFLKSEHAALHCPVEWNVRRGKRLAVEPGGLCAVGDRSDDVGCKVIQSNEAREIAGRATEPLRQASEVEFAVRIRTFNCLSGLHASAESRGFTVNAGQRSGAITLTGTSIA